MCYEHRYLPGKASVGSESRICIARGEYYSERRVCTVEGGNVMLKADLYHERLVIPWTANLVAVEGRFLPWSRICCCKRQFLL